MLYEMRTYNLQPGGVAEFEANFEKRLPFRQKHSKLNAFWHTEVGPLNQVVHIWEYEDLNQRMAVRAAMAQDAELQAHPPATNLIITQESDIMMAAPFMKPLAAQNHGTGNIYELRSYTYKPGTMGQVLKLWGEAIPYREKLSPLVAGMYSELGGLNKWVHIWVYKDLNERVRIRAESMKDPHWPAPTREFLVRQENKILLPASCSPLR